MTLELPFALMWTLPLASVRVLAMMIAAPIFGHAAVPVRVRVAFGVVLAAFLSPVVAPDVDLADPSPLIAAGWVAQEALIGVTVGFGLRLIFEVFAPVGELISLQGGLGAANVLDPSSGASSVVLGVLLQVFSLVVFLAVDGHHALLRGLALSFERLPIGGAMMPTEAFSMISGLGATLYDVAARLAAPLTVVMLVTNVGVGILGRSIPQLNLMALQLPAHIAITLLILGLIANPLGEAIAGILTGFTDDVLFQLLGGV